MRAENLPALQVYIENEIGTSTTRHASEERFACPAIPDAVTAERQMRTTMHVMFDGQVAVDTSEISSTPVDELAAIKAGYWDLAQHATPAHGAKPDFVLDDYFHVGQDRHYDAIRASVAETYAPDSITAAMFSCLESYRTELDLDVNSASRILATLFGSQLSDIKRNAALLEAEGMAPKTAANQAIREFTLTVADHIAELKKRAGEGLNIKALINKSSLYPQSTAIEYDDKPLRISREDAEGIAKAYRVQERPYTDAELATAEQLMQQPAMQSAILQFHTGMVDYATAYLAQHPERAAYSLEPFSEIFIPHEQNGETVYIPNPKLIKVIGNNTVPAIARVLAEAGVGVQDLTGGHIQLGIELAKKLRVFQAQIGQFNNYDEQTDTVDLTSMFNRTCPAMQMFSEALTKQLPDLYDQARQ